MTKQLNPFEIKALINGIINDNANDVRSIELLDAQNDKKTIVKILYKELYNNSNSTVLCFLLERYADKEDLTKKLCEMLKSSVISDNVKINVVNFLRGLDTDWALDTGMTDTEILDIETRNLLNNAVVNPEIQIDFLDFLSSISTNDKITLINSLGEDYTNDALANLLIPVFLSQPESEIGLEALKILGETKSQLAFHALNTTIDTADEKIKPYIKKSLSTLKIAGIREDNSLEFYKQILSTSKPYRCCLTYPDGHGNQAVIFTRKTDEGKVKFMAVVIDDYHGVRDCFGFYDISAFECDKIIERFYKNENELEVSPQILKSVLINAENLTKGYPYEYVCWKNLLCDIEFFDIKEYLKEKLSKNELNQKDLEVIFNSDFAQKWFLDEHYSDEFEEMLEDNLQDFEKLIENHVEKVFYPEEKAIWCERLINTAFLKLAQGDTETAQALYNLYFGEKTEFFKNILRKSLYEYFVSLRYNNTSNLSTKEINDAIKNIEDMYVQSNGS